jgi:hypothetical protein
VSASGYSKQGGTIKSRPIKDVLATLESQVNRDVSKIFS